MLAPCVLPLLPVIIGGSAAGASEDKKATLRHVSIIIASLSVSVFTFTLLLKATTSLLGIPQEVWQILAGSIVIAIGLTFVFPLLWPTIALKLGIEQKSNEALSGASQRKGKLGAIFTGAALGPVFTSCSPTYALILAAVLPASFALGILYLLAYVAGIALLLFLVAYFGARLVRKLGWALNPNGVFHKVLGVLFISVGIAVILGFDKSAQTWLLERGIYDGSTGLEEQF